MGTNRIPVSEQAVRVKQMLVWSGVPFDMSSALSAMLQLDQKRANVRVVSVLRRACADRL